METILDKLLGDAVSAIVKGVFGAAIAALAPFALGLLRKRRSAPAIAEAGAKPVIVTVIAEAVFDSQREIAGWAVWVRSGRTMLQLQGFATDITAPQQAGMTAVARGVELVLRAIPNLSEGDVIVIRTSDSGAAKALDQRTKLRLSKAERALRKSILDMAGTSKLRLLVKSHDDPGGDPAKRQHISSKCQAEARSMLHAGQRDQRRSGGA